MLSVSQVADVRAEESVPADVEAFMLFMAESMTDQGQLLTPMDFEQEIEATDYPDENVLPDTDSGMEGKQ